MKKIEEYSNYIGYGIGVFYEYAVHQINKKIKLNYLCDRKWDNTSQQEYNGIPIIQRKNIHTIPDALVIVFSGSAPMWKSMQADLEALKIPYIHANRIIGDKMEITGAELKVLNTAGRYTDNRGNEIIFDETVSDDIRIRFWGSNNHLHIGKNLLVRKLLVSMGINGTCIIGDNTEIIGAEFIVSNAKLILGRNCLIASEVIIRTHDGHHIFDMQTRERINYERDVVVGDHVWLAYRVQLLPGAEIGEDSVVGAGAITSSKFGSHLVIAGCPAKEIRNNICWDKAALDYVSYDSMEQ